MERENNVINLHATPLRCEEISLLLSDYVDEELEAGLRVQFERHLEGCDECRALLDDCRQLLRIARSLGESPIPDGVRERLHKRLEEECLEKGTQRKRGLLLIRGEKADASG